jgi:hypothetical protein
VIFHRQSLSPGRPGAHAYSRCPVRNATVRQGSGRTPDPLRPAGLSWRPEIINPAPG